MNFFVSRRRNGESERTRSKEQEERTGLKEKEKEKEERERSESRQSARDGGGVNQSLIKHVVKFSSFSEYLFHRAFATASRSFGTLRNCQRRFARMPQAMKYILDVVRELASCSLCHINNFDTSFICVLYTRETMLGVAPRISITNNISCGRQIN